MLADGATADSLHVAGTNSVLDVVVESSEQNDDVGTRQDTVDDKVNGTVLVVVRVVSVSAGYVVFEIERPEDCEVQGYPISVDG